MELLQVENLSVTVGAEALLDSVTFLVESGDYLAVFGPNGAGKTTLIRALLGLQGLSSGHIYWRGNRTVGYVPQKPEFVSKNFPTTTSEIIASGKIGSTKMEVSEAAETFGISSLLKKQFKTLSGGQKQLAMAARSIISKPRLLILDEPMAGVDIEHSGTYLEKLKSLNLTGTAIIMVTHELDIIQKEASKVLWLNKKVIFFGVKDEFLRLAHETHIDQHPHD